MGTDRNWVGAAGEQDEDGWRKDGRQMERLGGGGALLGVGGVVGWRGFVKFSGVAGCDGEQQA